jgi:hypothetical protein
MKTIMILAVGIFIGQKISKIQASNLATEKEVSIRKQIQQFLQENLPSLSATEINQTISEILKGKAA